jgi:hypothetical protein
VTAGRRLVGVVVGVWLAVRALRWLALQVVAEMRATDAALDDCRF